MIRLLILIAAIIAYALIGIVAAKADCSRMTALAQEHAYSMHTRQSLDHKGFADRAARGARAENVALASSKEQAIAMWMRSPAHYANMLLPGCRGYGWSGRYHVMEIGQ